MPFEKAAPTDSDVGDEFQRTPDESQLSCMPGNKSDNEAQLEDDAPPDGGATAWLVVLGGWCCSFNSMGWMNSKPFRTLMFPFGQFDIACHKQIT
jgi:hypothetical protein